MSSLSDRYAPGSLSKEDIFAFAAKVMAERGLSDLQLWHFPGRAVLSLAMIKVSPEHRGQGKAEAALRDVCAFADKHKLTVVLSPSGDFGSSKAMLVKWYRRHGFVLNKGRNKDFTTQETMLRLPR